MFVSIQEIVSEQIVFEEEFKNVTRLSELTLKRVLISEPKLRVNVTLVNEEESLDFEETVETRVMPAPLCLLPLFFALFFCVVLRDALPGLFIGVWVSSTLVNDYNPIKGFLLVFSHFFAESWIKSGNAKLIIFGIMIGGFYSLVRISGGFLKFGKLLGRVLNTSTKAQVVTLILGCFITVSGPLSIFLVGSAMLPILDSLTVSRDKLAFLIDVTSGPVSSTSPFSIFMRYQKFYILKKQFLYNNPFSFRQ